MFYFKYMLSIHSNTHPVRAEIALNFLTSSPFHETVATFRSAFVRRSGQSSFRLVSGRPLWPEGRTGTRSSTRMRRQAPYKNIEKVKNSFHWDWESIQLYRLFNCFYQEVESHVILSLWIIHRPLSANTSFTATISDGMQFDKWERICEIVSKRAKLQKCLIFTCDPMVSTFYHPLHN